MTNDNIYRKEEDKMTNGIEIVELKGYKGEFISCRRVCYGKKDTHRNDREFKSGNSPIGTIENWQDMAKALNMKGVIFEDPINNERIILELHHRGRTMKILDHETRTLKEVQ